MISSPDYVDADAAVRAAFDHERPAVAVIKHANPCGIAVGDDDAADPVAQAHARAHACDPVSAFGGVVAPNRPVTAGMAAQLADVFTEVVVAPSFTDDALRLLTARKNVRLLELPEGYRRDEVEWRQVSGGMLVQVRDAVDAAGDDPATWRLAAGDPADDAAATDGRLRSSSPPPPSEKVLSVFDVAAVFETVTRCSVAAEAPLVTWPRAAAAKDVVAASPSLVADSACEREESVP